MHAGRAARRGDVGAIVDDEGRPCRLGLASDRLGKAKECSAGQCLGAQLQKADTGVEPDIRDAKGVERPLGRALDVEDRVERGQPWGQVQAVSAMRADAFFSGM